MVKTTGKPQGKILWIDAELNRQLNLSRYAIIRLQIKKGYDIWPYKSLSEIPLEIRQQMNQFDLIVVEPFSAMVNQNTRELYNELRKRFSNLPPLTGQLKPGIEIIDALRVLAPSVPIIIYTNILKDGPFEYYLNKIRGRFPDIKIFFKITVEDKFISAVEDSLDIAAH
jgi:hypothetical protein